KGRRILPPCGGDVRQDRGGQRRALSSQNYRSPDAHSVHFTLVRSFAWIGAFSQSPSSLASHTPILGSSNRKPFTASSARIFCACLKSSVRLASSAVRLSWSITLSKARLSELK